MISWLLTLETNLKNRVKEQTLIMLSKQQLQKILYLMLMPKIFESIKNLIKTIIVF